MKNIKTTTLVAGVALVAWSLSANAQTKPAQTGNPFAAITCPNDYAVNILDLTTIANGVNSLDLAVKNNSYAAGCISNYAVRVQLPLNIAYAQLTRLIAPTKTAPNPSYDFDAVNKVLTIIQPAPTAQTGNSTQQFDIDFVKSDYTGGTYKLDLKVNNDPVLTNNSVTAVASGTPNPNSAATTKDIQLKLISAPQTYVPGQPITLEFETSLKSGPSNAQHHYQYVILSGKNFTPVNIVTTGTKTVSGVSSALVSPVGLPNYLLPAGQYKTGDKYTIKYVFTPSAAASNGTLELAVGIYQFNWKDTDLSNNYMSLSIPVQ